MTAVDFSPTALKRGSRLAERYGVRIDFVVANAAAYEPDGEVELVT